MTKLELEIQIEDWKQGLISDIDLKTAVDAYLSASNDGKPIVGRSFVLSALESKRLENWIKEGCKSIKFDLGSGIGTKVSVRAKNNKWVDITDYGCW